MIDSNIDSWENRIVELAAALDYPSTPDIVAGVRQRLAKERGPAVTRPWYTNRLAWMVTAVLLTIAMLLAVPQARAAIFEFFQIGDIRIFPNEPALTPVDDEALTPMTATPIKTAEATVIPGFSVANLYGETTLAELRKELGDAVIQPDYPMGIGLPDQIFFQDQIGPLGIMTWLETDSTEKVWAILYILNLDQGAFGAKFAVESLQGTTVNGRPAYWVEGNHMLVFYDEDGRVVFQGVRLVEGNTLIWTVDEVTYRLETVLSLEEAVRMAESMR